MVVPCGSLANIGRSCRREGVPGENRARRQALCGERGAVQPEQGFCEKEQWEIGLAAEPVLDSWPLWWSEQCFVYKGLSGDSLCCLSGNAPDIGWPAKNTGRGLLVHSCGSYAPV